MDQSLTAVLSEEICIGPMALKVRQKASPEAGIGPWMALLSFR